MKLQRGRDGTQSDSRVPVFPRGCERQGAEPRPLWGWRQGGSQGPEDVRGWLGRGPGRRPGLGLHTGPRQATSSHLRSQPKHGLCWLLLETALGPGRPARPGRVVPLGRWSLGCQTGLGVCKDHPPPNRHKILSAVLSGRRAVGQQRASWQGPQNLEYGALAPMGAGFGLRES